MRWQLTLQLAAGLAALFGVGYTAIDSYVEPPASALLQRTAAAEAATAAGDAAIEWQRMKTVQQRLVRSGAESPIIANMGAQYGAGEPRQRAIKAALDALVAQAGSDGQAVLVTPQGTVVASAGELVAPLAKGAAMKDALLGGTAVRFELVEGVGRLVAAAPITGGGSQVIGVLVLASPIDNQRLNLWATHLPMGAAVVLSLGKEIFATTLAGKKAAELAAPDLGASVDIDGETYATSARELVDDAGVVVRSIGVSRHDQSFLLGIKTRVQFLVLSFGALAILLCVAVMMMSPLRPRIEVRSIQEHQENAPPPTPSSMPAMVRKQLPDQRDPDAFFEEQTAGSEPLPQAQPQMNRPPVRQLMPPQPRDAESVQDGASRTPDRISAQRLEKPAASQSQGAMARNDTRPLSPKKQSQHDQEAIPLPASRPQPALSQPANPDFDVIAAAAMSSPPQPQSQQAAQASIDPHTDLPMPIEHLQLPTTRESVQPQFSRASRSTQMPRGFGGGNGNSPTDDPWRNASLPPSNSSMRQQQVPNSDDLPHVRHDATTARNSVPPSLSSSRPYQPSVSSSQPLANREPVAFDEEHYRVVYNEFVGSKARLGEAVDNITFEGFSSKLRSSEKELIDRHGCKAVRFQVLVKDRQVSLRPQLVR